MLLSNMCNLSLELVATHSSNKQNATCQLFAMSSGSSDYKRVVLNYRWLLIPQIITSVSQYLFFTSDTEFLVSQCPYAMRGLIIGAACTTCGVSFVLHDNSLRIEMWL